ncbi:hypothetical protein M9H77_02518 [Catharanthus roseus]|uniref:Uncharacterized protein n=1 Tax=Catharanthus roseus TaxID=4058 RepID=A0ACC0C8P4_CATRO|nr:hypothetical protein M9H77_02518 [Catharanthus roseus]
MGQVNYNEDSKAKVHMEIDARPQLEEDDESVGLFYKISTSTNIVVRAHTQKHALTREVARVVKNGYICNVLPTADNRFKAQKGRGRQRPIIDGRLPLLRFKRTIRAESTSPRLQESLTNISVVEESKRDECLPKNKSEFQEGDPEKEKRVMWKVMRII